ncbi:hypothetical protein CBR_g39357 [Chara braunii]|uniref:Uncharacterized protein n=1 Tax=Chara braunii TaxID=69332 RepID=A0A388LRD7_CHABU|nr:hypothetical protein CBR_g39357 [Chara braunii]|eukprot:GBG84896.1 hypothetical protein CBR_g39357 [Chara braunii]
MDDAPGSCTPDDGRSAEQPPNWTVHGNATPVSPHAGQRGLLGVSPYCSPNDMRSTKRPRVQSHSPADVVTPGVAVVHSPLPPLLPSPAHRPYTPIHPLSDFDALCFSMRSPPLQPRRLQFLSCAAQPFPPPPLVVGRDGLDSIPLEGCSQSSAAVFGSGGSTLRDRGRRSAEPWVPHSFAASGHGQGGVLDDVRRACAGDTHDRSSGRRSLVSRFDGDDIVCGSGDRARRCDPAAQNLVAGPSEQSGGSLGQFGSKSTGSTKYSRLFLTSACKERLCLLQSTMKEVSEKSGVMSDVIDRLLHWSLPAIRLEFGDGVASRIKRTLTIVLRCSVSEQEGMIRQRMLRMMASVRAQGAVEAMAGHFVGQMIHFRVLAMGHSVATDRPGGHRAVAGRVRISIMYDLCVGIIRRMVLCRADLAMIGLHMCWNRWATGKTSAAVVPCDRHCGYDIYRPQRLLHCAWGDPVHKPTVYSCMRSEPNVREGWNAKAVRQGLRYCDLAIDTVMRSGRPVTLMVDGRYDSARSAQHCTVTATECDTRLVVGVHTLRPKKQGKSSNQLEVPAVVRLLRGLLSRGLRIRCVVSDDCAALGPQLERLGIEWQKDCHHKVKNIRKALRKTMTLKVPKKLNNPQQCVSESQFMQFTKKELLDALTDRYGPGCLTTKEERLKKSGFVVVVMSKMYRYDTMTNNQSLLVDADGVTEFHMHEVGHWFLRASQLCRDEGDDFVTLHNDIMMIVDHWAGDHSRCVADKELLCSKAGGPSRLPLYTRDDPVYDIIRQTLGRHCSTTICSYYTEFRHTSTLETFQGTIIIYKKKALHFGKSYEPRLAIAVIRWNSHAWQDPLEYRVLRPSGTSIRPRPSHYHHNRPPTDSWMDRLSTFIFGSQGVSGWARRLLEYDDCDVGRGLVLDTFSSSRYFLQRRGDHWP